MKILIFSVYDSKTGIWGHPNFMVSKGAALRTWADAAVDAQSNIGKHPADYTLFLIGEWDDEKGVITMYDVKENFGTALEMIPKDNEKTVRQIQPKEEQPCVQ